MSGYFTEARKESTCFSKVTPVFCVCPARRGACFGNCVPCPASISISKPILVIPQKAKPYEVSLEQAKRIVSGGNGIWKGRNRVYLHPDKSKRGIWEPKPSGYAGPLVLQLT